MSPKSYCTLLKFGSPISTNKAYRGENVFFGLFDPVTLTFDLGSPKIIGTFYIPGTIIPPGLVLIAPSMLSPEHGQTHTHTHTYKHTYIHTHTHI